MDALTGIFAYVFVPANEEEPIEQREGDKSGGLSDDVLVNTAKQYFFQQSGGDARAAALTSASPEERTSLAQQLRAQITSENPNAASQLSKMEDDALVSLVQSTQGSPSCEIMILTVPTKGNQYHAVSMYASDNPGGLRLNPRATALMKACGHAFQGEEAGVNGDVFVGRCIDNEADDVWRRIDLTAKEVESPDTAEWCAIARSPGGGGGSGAAAAPSLRGLMTQSSSSGEEVTWSQSDDEVEIKFQVASGTKAKYVKVSFAMTTLKVVVAGQTLLQGNTGGNVDVDASTYTLQDVPNARELCVVLGKNNVGTIWPHAVAPKS